MNRFARRTTLAALALALPGFIADARAQLTIDPLFGSNMVLQRDQPITLWGTAEPGAVVNASLPPSLARGTADEAGRWEVTFPPRPAGGPAKIVVRSGSEARVLDDVLFGDVWVCSGQSNMGWRINQSERGAEFIARAQEFEYVRLFTVERAWDREPQTVVDTRGWQTADADSLAAFSAVGFHFGRILNGRTRVPIGLIHSSWGGTPLEAWTPMPTLEARPDVYRARLASLAEYDMPEEQVARLRAAADQKHADFAAFAWREGIGHAAGWHELRFDDTDWPALTLPGWADAQAMQHLAQTDPTKTYNLEGIIWLRKTIDLPADVEGQPATLRLARVDDYDETYINGTMVGATRLSEDGKARSRRVYDVPAGVLVEGRNVIAVRLMDVRSSGGVIPGEDEPFELEHAGGTTPLAGDWRFRVGFDSRDHGNFPPPSSHALSVGRMFRRPAVLYNAMIYPLHRLGVAGVIWYQGESNSGRGDEYREMFPDMINAWQARWTEARNDSDYELPFYFVQLPNFRQRKTEPGESNWAEIREAQRLTLARTENTGMAVTIDLGDPNDIHPTSKVPVAERLARVALAERYGVVDRPVTGPTPTVARRRESTVLITYDHAEGLKTTDGAQNVEGFAIAQDDGTFVWADARVLGDQVIVQAEGIDRPVRIRYAWADNPAVNLVNEAGLPAVPFEMTIE